MRRLITLIALAAALAGTGGSARAGDTFRVAPLTQADGQGWGGLRFGATTPQQIKARYSVDGDNDVPRSLRLKTPDDSGVQVRALFVGKKDSDPLEAVSLRYAPGALDLPTLQSDLGENGQARYARERFDDWWVQDFPDKGIVAFVTQTPGGADVSQILLLPQACVTPALHSLTDTASPASAVVDPHAGEPRIVAFGTTRVSGNVNGLHGMENLTLRLDRRLVDGTAGGALRYVVGAAGRYTADISGDFDPGKGGHIKVECRIDGASPYGPVVGQGRGERDLRAGDDPVRAFWDASHDAMDRAESDLAHVVSQQGPPTPLQLRQAAWDRLFQAARQAGADAVPTP